MEENKKPDETEGKKPEENVTPKEEKEDKKNKAAAFFSVKRNKIIVGVSVVAVVALAIGLTVGLTQCSNKGGDATGSESTSTATSEKGDESIAHVHTVSTGVLDLNGDKAQINGICSGCNEKVDADIASGATFTSVLCGYYPQKHVNDATLIASLDALTAAESNGWYKLGDTYYAKAAHNENHYDTTFDDGTKIMYGTYFWFKVEPIEWNILSSSNGQYSLVSKLLLDAHAYDAEYNNNYKDSDIRAWLNGEFYNKAFAKGSSFIATTNVDNSAITTGAPTNEHVCENTDDKVYLLSYQDYVNTAYFATDAARQCKTSDWTRNNFAECEPDADYAGTYWTRSPDSTSGNCVWYVEGDIDNLNEMETEDSAKTYFSVRPAITVSLAK